MKRQLVIGWLLASDIDKAELLESFDGARQRLLEQLCDQFPETQWQLPLIHRRIHAPHGALDPLSLLDLGGEEKLHQGWDFALVIVPNELMSRQRIVTIGVPSSPLETAVLSSARLGEGSLRANRIAGLAQHLLGHLWGLNHSTQGPMRAVDDPLELTMEPFPEEETEFLRTRHERLSRTRLENDSTNRNAVRFYARTIQDDFTAILKDVANAKPWKMPLYLGRLTAAAAVSTILMLFSSDAWALGARLDHAWVLVSTLFAIVIATGSVYVGQNIGHQGRLPYRSEQLIRTRIVLLGILSLGMFSLWCILLLIAIAVGNALPRNLIVEWAGLPLDAMPSANNYAFFVADVGVLAASLGGNLEEQSELKAELLFDEET